MGDRTYTGLVCVTTGQRLPNIDFSNLDPIDGKGLKKNLLESLTQEEIRYLINKGLLYGNNLEKIARTLNYSESAKFKMLSGKISLSSKAAGRHGVSLSRICQAFPDMTLDILQVSPNIGPVTLDECIRASGRPEFPTIARHSACASIIPRTNFRGKEEAVNVILMASMLFAEKVNKTESWLSQSGPQKLREQFRFLQKFLTTFDVPADERVELCLKYGVVDKNYKLTEAWVSTAEAATAYLKTKYKGALEGPGLHVTEY